MARPSGMWCRRSSLMFVTLVVCLAAFTPAWGQEAPVESPPSPPAGGQPGAPGPQAPAELPAPPVPPGQPPAPALPGPASVPPPIIPGLPPITSPGGPPGEVIGPARELQFAPFPELAAPFQLRTYASVQQEFTDNANQTRNDRKSEFRTTIAPGIAAQATGARSSINLAYAPRVIIPYGCSGCTDTFGVDHDVTLRGWHDLTPRLRMSMGEDYTRSSDFRQFGNLGAQSTSGKAVDTNTATGELAYTFGKYRVGGSYSNSLVRSGSGTTEDSTTHVGRGTLDFTDLRYGAGGSYALTRADFKVSSPYWEHTLDGHAYRLLTPNLRGTLSGSFTEHDVDHVTSQNFRIARGRLGGAVSVGPEGSLSAEAGTDVFMLRDHGPRVFPAGKVTYSHRFPILAMAVSYEESLAQQFQTAGIAALTHTRSASLLLSSVTFRDLTASVGTSFNWQKIQQGTATSGVPGEVDRTLDVEGRLQYFILRPLSLTLGYVVTFRTSNVPTVGFLENRINLSLSYAYNLL
jgi:hypothetical protein